MHQLQLSLILMTSCGTPHSGYYHFNTTAAVFNIPVLAHFNKEIIILLIKKVVIIFIYYYSFYLEILSSSALLLSIYIYVLR